MRDLAAIFEALAMNWDREFLGVLADQPDASRMTILTEAILADLRRTTETSFGETFYTDLGDY